jgi:hypothetical protein
MLMVSNNSRRNGCLRHTSYGCSEIVNGRLVLEMPTTESEISDPLIKKKGPRLRLESWGKSLSSPPPELLNGNDNSVCRIREWH